MAFWPQNSQGHHHTIEELRGRYAALFARFGAAPAGMDVTQGKLGAIPGEWVGAGGDGRVILYFHGGGFVAGSPESHRPLVGKLVAASGVGAFSVGYRLAPECFFPAAVRDGIDAYRALLAKGVSAPSVILAGDEAGGGLAFAVALAIRNAGLEMPGGLVALSPWADLSLVGPVDAEQPQIRYRAWTGKRCFCRRATICASPIPAMPMLRQPIPLLPISRR